MNCLLDASLKKIGEKLGRQLRSNNTIAEVIANIQDSYNTFDMIVTARNTKNSQIIETMRSEIIWVIERESSENAVITHFLEPIKEIVNKLFEFYK